MPFERVEKWNVANNLGRRGNRAVGCALAHNLGSAMPTLRIGENVQQAIGLFPPARVTLLRGTGPDAGSFAVVPDQDGEWKVYHSGGASSKSVTIACGMIFKDAPKFSTRPVQWSVRDGALIVRIPDDLLKYQRKTEKPAAQAASPLNGLRASAVA